MATAAQRPTRSPILANRGAVVVVTVLGVLAVTLLIYAMGRAYGGAFTYVWLSGRWPALITTPKVIAAALAVATIGLMTLRRDSTPRVRCLWR